MRLAGSGCQRHHGNGVGARRQPWALTVAADNASLKLRGAATRYQALPTRTLLELYEGGLRPSRLTDASRKEVKPGVGSAHPAITGVNDGRNASTAHASNYPQRAFAGRGADQREIVCGRDPRWSGTVAAGLTWRQPYALSYSACRCAPWRYGEAHDRQHGL